MGQSTKIEWADATWNPVIGCSHVSAGCDNCYAEQVATRFAWDNAGNDGMGDMGYYVEVVRWNLDSKAAGWDGRTVRKDPKFNPLTARKPRTIFVCSMGDLFHKSVPDEWIDEVMAVIAMTPQHRYMILTKRADRMAEYFDVGSDREFRAIRIMTTLDMYQDELIDSPEYDPRLESRQDQASCRISLPDGWPLPNLALGVSIENQKTADQRVPLLLQTPAARRFVSYEPALEPVDIRGIGEHCPTHDYSGGFCIGPCPDRRKLDLVIMGGESGPKARPMNPEWARSMRDQCASAGVPFHFKQWGEWWPHDQGQWVSEAEKYVDTDSPDDDHYRIGKKAAGRLLDGQEHNGTINWEN